MWGPQVYPDVDGPLLAVETAALSSPLLAHMADELARLLLPPVTDLFPPLPSKSPPKRYGFLYTSRRSIHLEFCAKVL